MLTQTQNAAAERIGGPESRAVAIDADACASRYGISKRHWLRLVDAGKAPQPLRLGRLVRWAIASGCSSLEAWEADGCPKVRQLSTKGGRP